MKKLIAVTVVALCMSLLFVGCDIFHKSASAKNAKVDYTGEASVGFYPVCPECNHVSPKSYVNISDGEQEEFSYLCEECYELYMITIDRK